MQILKTPVSTTYEIKQSKFIAHLVPYKLFDATLQRLKEEHPKGRHFVTAFRYLNDHMQVVEGSSDDGEPKGTSGKPSLAVLAGHELIDAAVIIVRYFGGTKLGTGGLVRAYTQAVSDAVALAELSEYIPQEKAAFTCGYSAVSQVEYLLTESGVTEVEKVFEATTVLWYVSGGDAALETFFARVGRLVEHLEDGK
ncbi:YigZ family protein [Sulfurimonas sp. HSL-3221]|uniref:YigZ family protein n=1 Tax=Sulfurimonadaceae TaxID=2771471 RepID=UPI001E4E2D3F|nr:YigZ family protein [Sulfurimonas sp. HSL-3221]UFS63345.1 YigZ family protein [Sulfurimonas sp. HSL-3221]